MGTSTSVKNGGMKILKGVRIALKSITLDFEELESSKNPKSDLD